MDSIRRSLLSRLLLKNSQITQMEMEAVEVIAEQVERVKQKIIQLHISLLSL